MANLKQLLAKKLTVKQIEKVNRAFDIVGNIAITQIPEELEKKEKIIANAILDSNKHIQTVVKKVGIHSGTLRIQKTKIIGGKRSKETIHVENKVRIMLNIDKTYFSPRTSNERARIASLVGKEDVLVLFSGVAPFPLVISKNSPAKSIVGIEINKKAHEYAQKNVNLNKISNITLYCADARKQIPKLKKKFDRIIMPLPKDAHKFLEDVIKVSKKGSIIHLYTFMSDDEIKNSKDFLKSINTTKKNFKFIRVVKTSQTSPHVFRVCIDFKIE